MQHVSLIDDRAAWGLLDRYVAGECVGEELRQVEQWLADTPQAADAVVAMRGVRAESNVERVSFDLERPWGIVVREMGERSGNGKPTDAHPGRRTRSRSLEHARLTRRGSSPRQGSPPVLRGVIPYIAALCGAVVVTLLAHGTGVFSHLASSADPVTSLRTFTTSQGERARLQFSDGSSVLLAPQSVVRYSDDFGSADRTVQIEGQGLFSIVHGNKHPFVVHAGDVETRVLGTSFSVRKYPSDRITEVVVATGKVAVAKDSALVPLATGDRLSIGADGVPDVRHAVNIAAEFAWADGKLVFRESLLRDVIPELKRWYGFEVGVSADALLDEPVTLSLTTEHPTQVVQLLEVVLNARASQQGSRIVFTPQS